MTITLSQHQKHTNVVTEALLAATGVSVKEKHVNARTTIYYTGGHAFKSRKALNETLIDFLNAVYFEGNFDLTAIREATNSYGKKAFEITE